MFQETPFEKSKKGKKITDGKCAIKMKDIVYPALLQLSKTKVKYKLVRDNKVKPIPDTPIIFAVNHTRFQDTPVICAAIRAELKRRGYVFSGKQKLGFLDNIFFYFYGSLFLDRENKEDMAIAQKAMEEYLRKDKIMIVFPEGTWNMSDELLMLPMKWGIVKSAQRTNAQIIPTVLHYDDQNMNCHVSFGEPIVFNEQTDAKEAIDNLRDTMATMRFQYMEKQGITARETIDVECEKDKIYDVVREYPNYDYDYEQSFVYQPHEKPEHVFAHVKKLIPNKNNAFLFNKRNSGIR